MQRRPSARTGLLEAASISTSSAPLRLNLGPGAADEPGLGRAARSNGGGGQTHAPTASPERALSARDGARDAEVTARSSLGSERVPHHAGASHTGSRALGHRGPPALSPDKSACLTEVTARSRASVTSDDGFSSRGGGGSPWPRSHTDSQGPPDHILGHWYRARGQPQITGDGQREGRDGRCQGCALETFGGDGDSLVEVSSSGITEGGASPTNKEIPSAVIMQRRLGRICGLLDRVQQCVERQELIVHASPQELEKVTALHSDTEDDSSDTSSTDVGDSPR